jgi:hypothetical protein
MKFSRLILANLFRKKVRLILTIGSFAVALFLFAFLAVVKDAFGRGADVAGADLLAFRCTPVRLTIITGTLTYIARDRMYVVSTG